jgi:3-hydroxymyristoyl/3-hydroxydecanoyl-(acyl carrier protein) dehydratase
MDPATIAAITSAAVSLFGASSADKAGREAARLAKEGGYLSQWASYANASDAERIGSLNAGAITAAAANNALATREIGYANAEAITEATMHNLGMYKIQSDEEQRVHLMEERWAAGEIRARMSATGVMVNSGSALAYLRSEIKKGIQERNFMKQRDLYAMIGLAEDGLRQSILTVKTANWNARITEENAAMQAGVVMAEAMAQAAAMRRQGDIVAQVGVANAQAARYQGTAAALAGIGNALSSAGSAYASWKAGQPTAQPSQSTATTAIAGS